MLETSGFPAAANARGWQIAIVLSAARRGCAIVVAIALCACGDRAEPPPKTVAAASRTVPKPPTSPRAPSQDAFRIGGIPLRDDLIDHATDEVLHALLDAANTHARVVDRALFDRARALFAGRDHDLDDAWRTLVAEIDRWRQARPTDLVAVSALQPRARVLNDAFARLGLGYYLHASDTTDTSTRRITGIFDVYRVTRVDHVLAGGAARRVLELEAQSRVTDTPPAGELDASPSGDGDIREPQGLVYLDTVERVLRWLVPAIARTAPTFPTAYEAGLDAQGRDPRSVIGAAIRREIEDAIGAPDDLDRWREQIRTLTVASCARHVFQHILDWERDAWRARPAAKTAVIGSDVSPFVDSELTANVSQLANEPALPHSCSASSSSSTRSPSTRTTSRRSP